MLKYLNKPLIFVSTFILTAVFVEFLQHVSRRYELSKDIEDAKMVWHQYNDNLQANQNFPNIAEFLNRSDQVLVVKIKNRFIERGYRLIASETENVTKNEPLGLKLFRDSHILEVQAGGDAALVKLNLDGFSKRTERIVELQ